MASLLVDGTPVPRKVARLHLICDILHNSAATVPSAWKFRQEFQARLGIVFDHLANIYHSFPGRITAETFKKQITSIIDIWEDWIVFPPDFTSELRIRLDGAVKESEPQSAPSTENKSGDSLFSSKFKTSTFQLASNIASTSQGFMAVGNSGVSAGTDLDGEPITEDLDGAPLVDDVDGIPVADDLDGVPVDDDLDGVPVDDDVDGVPVDDLGEPMDSEPCMVGQNKRLEFMDIADADSIDYEPKDKETSVISAGSESDGEPMDQSDEE